MTKNKLKAEPSEEKGKKKQVKKKSPEKVSFFKDQKVHYILGIFILVFSVFPADSLLLIPGHLAG